MKGCGTPPHITVIKMKKYVVVLMDGMADYPVEALGGKTPMMAANKPNLDFFAKNGEIGLVRTVAEGLSPGSDVANLSVMGYDPAKYYTGRSPLEAVSMGIELAPEDVALRCNLVTLSDDEPYENKTMVDYCAGDIHTPEARIIIEDIQKELGNDTFCFYPGIQYRHCLVWKNGTVDIGKLTPPHDISGKTIGEWLTTNPTAQPLREMMEKSAKILAHHPVNQKRISEGKRAANSIWLWGQGTKPCLDSFEEKFGLKGAVISAVDLLKGIGKCAGMEIIDVDGATGYIDTCFEAKTDAAIKALKNGCDFAYLHFEAPDECGHRGEVENKIKAIELIDSIVLGKLRKELEQFDDYKIMILPDHPTPLCIKTHVSDPVPYVIYDKGAPSDSGFDTINEETAKQSGNYEEVGHTLIEKFVKD